VADNETLAQTVKQLSEEIAELRKQTEDNDQRLAGGMATMVVLTKEHGRQIVRHVEIVTDAVRRELLQLRGAVNTMNPRSPSLTVVADVPHSKKDDVTGIFVLGKRIPSRWTKFMLAALLVLCVLMVLLGMGLSHYGIKPADVMKVAAPLVSP